MPNILAHTHITTSVFKGEHDVVLGSTLPDFAGIFEAQFGEHVWIKGLHPRVDQGVDFHYKTDSEFSSQPEAPAMTGPLWADLEEAGLQRRAARASAALAADILLDAALLDFDEPVKDFRRARQRVLAEGTEVFMHPDKRFRDLITFYFSFNRPYLYQDPRQVAEIIARRLATRDDPRELVLPEQQSVLADVLSAHSDRIASLGLSATSTTVQNLSAL